LHVFTAGTGRGKTQWALQVALAAAETGTPTLYVGLELGHTDLVARVLGLALCKEFDTEKRRAPKWSDLYFGRDRDALKRASKHEGRIRGLPLRLEVAPPFGWSADVLEARARTLREEHPEASKRPILLIVDYLQLVTAPPGAERRMEMRELIGKAAYTGRAVARDRGAVVLMLSSISRENSKLLAEDKEKGTGDPTRWESMGKEAGEIETAADTVMTMARGDRVEAPVIADGQREWCSEMHIAIAKQRGGSPAWNRLNFNGGWFWENSAEEIPSGQVDIGRPTKRR
jgi:replicative DNA helicase